MQQINTVKKYSSPSLKAIKKRYMKKEAILQLFNCYPAVNEFHFTKDGQAFINKAQAEDHQRSLTKKGDAIEEVGTITRAEVEGGSSSDAAPKGKGKGKGKGKAEATDVNEVTEGNGANESTEGTDGTEGTEETEQ
jgi:hypothetical protein